MIIDELLPNKIISIVGSGGKTTFMYAAARKLASLGKKVILTTSTKIFVPTEYPVLLLSKKSNLESINKNEIFSEINSKFKESPICATGILYTNNLPEEEYKLSSFLDAGISASELLNLTDADYVLIEADGSKHMPLKFPGPSEPVITDDTEMVIAVVGLWCIGKPINTVCHRFELACEFLSSLYQKSISPEHIVTEEDVFNIVNSPFGYKKNVNSRNFKLITFKNTDEHSSFEL
ncbi:MAG: selenium cofactor biosynthesis protein YqeC [Proteocatella sp.]